MYVYFCLHLMSFDTRNRACCSHTCISARNVVAYFDGVRHPLTIRLRNIGSRPSDHYFRSVCLFVCLSVSLFVCAEFLSAVFDPISIKLGHMLYVWV